MTKLAGDHAQVLAEGYELTTVSQSLAPSQTYDQHDATCFGQAAHNFINGQQAITMTHKGLLDKASSHAALNLTDVENAVVTALIGENAAPVVGGIAFLIDNKTGSYKVAAENTAAIPFEAELAVKSSRGGGWGKALAVPVTITNTTDGTAVDNAASSSNGGVATLHILAACAADTYAVKVQHSADDVTYADLVTFALDASVIGGEFGTVAVGTTVNRYLRYQATRTGAAGNDFRLAVAFARL